MLVILSPVLTKGRLTMNILTVTHEHQYGSDTYVAKIEHADQRITKQGVIDFFGIDFSKEKYDEGLDWEVTTNDDLKVYKDISTYQIGDMFYLSSYTGKHILCQVDYGKICLVSLKDGNRVSDTFTVKRVSHISKEDIDRASGNSIWELAERQGD
jgi:hypothetical protein